MSDSIKPNGASHGGAFLEGLKEGRRESEARINELLEANNRYLEDAREANRRFQKLDRAQVVLIQHEHQQKDTSKLDATHTIVLKVNNAACFDAIHAMGGDSSGIAHRLTTPLLMGTSPDFFDAIGLLAYGIEIESVELATTAPAADPDEKEERP